MFILLIIARFGSIIRFKISKYFFMISNRQPNIIIIDLKKIPKQTQTFDWKKRKEKNHDQMEMEFSQSLDFGD